LLPFADGKRARHRWVAMCEGETHVVYSGVGDMKCNCVS